MINLDFMPSRQLAVYAAKLFVTRSLAVLIALVLVLMTLAMNGLAIYLRYRMRKNVKW